MDMKKSTEGLASCCICEQIFDEKVMHKLTKVKYVKSSSSSTSAEPASSPFYRLTYKLLI